MIPSFPGKPLPNDAYSTSQRKENVNAYYYSGPIDLKALPQSTPTSPVYVIVRPPDEMETLALIASENQLRLIQAAPRLWVGRFDAGTAGPILLQMATGNVTYYQAFTDLKLPSENHALVTLFPVYPRRDVSDFKIRAVQSDYSRTNLFQPFQWFDRVTTNLTIKGLKTISTRSRFKRGTKDGFDTGTQRDEMLRVTVAGKVNDVDVLATFQDSSVVLDDSNKNSILLMTDNWEGYFGEYWAEMNALQLMPFNKRLDGMKAKYKSPRFNFTGMVSESKGTPAHDRLYGKNSQGPYPLSNRPLVIHSEQVVYLGRVLVRDTDYTVDYDLGQMTFRKEFVPDTDLFVVDYEYSDAIFKKAFAAVYGEWTSTGNDRVIGPISVLGVGYQMQVERGGVATLNGIVAHPKTQTIAGAKAAMTVLPGWTGATEVALSTLTADNAVGGIDSAGLAIDQRTEWVDQWFKIRGNFKKLTGQFQPIGTAVLQPGYWGYSTGIGMTPMPWWQIDFAHDSEAYARGDGLIQNQSWDFSTNVDRLSLGYYRRLDQDYSVSTNILDRTIQRQSVSWKIPLQWVVLQPSYRFETGENRITSAANFRNTVVQLNSNSQFGDTLQLSSGVEWLQQDTNLGTSKSRQTMGLSSSLTPNPDYSMDATVKFVNDTAEGQSLLSAINYSIRPYKALRFNGNYNVETVEELLGSTTYRVIKHQLNMGVGWRPINGLSLGYKFKPTLAENRDLGGLRYEDRLVNQYNLTYEGWNNMMIGIDHKTSLKMVLDKNRLPASVVSQTGNDRTTLAQLDYRINDRSSLRYTIDTESTVGTNLSPTLGTENYDVAESVTTRHSLEYQSQLSPVLKATAAYRLAAAAQTQSISPSSNANTLTHSAELSAEWADGATLLTRFVMSGEKSIDLYGILPDTYLLVPRLEVRYRPWAAVTVGGFFEYTGSFSGQSTRRRKGSIYAKYDTRVGGLLDTALSAQLDYGAESAPLDFETYDALLKFTVLF